MSHVTHTYFAPSFKVHTAFAEGIDRFLIFSDVKVRTRLNACQQRLTQSFSGLAGVPGSC